MVIWTMEQEATALRARFAGVNRAAFAREHNLKGGQALIYQHINAVRPISLEAAKAYAKGFGVGLEEISPRLASEVRSAAPYASATQGKLQAEHTESTHTSRSKSDWPFTASREDFEKLRPEDRRALDKTLTGFISGTLASYETVKQGAEKPLIPSTEKRKSRTTMDHLDEAIAAIEEVAQGRGRGSAKRANSGRGRP
jgi:hypothetical protein